MTCIERLINWLSKNNIPGSEQSILRDLQTIGIVEV